MPHQRSHAASVLSSYGSFTDGSQRQDDQSSLTHSNSNNMNDTAGSSSQKRLLISLLVLLIIAATAVTFHPSIATWASVSMIALESSSAASASANSLIDTLQSSSTIIHPQSFYKAKVDEYPSLSIDLEHERQVYNGRTTNEQTSITIEWTNGRFRSSSTDILNRNSNEKSIIALLCGQNDSHLYYVDAKTLSDAASSDNAHRNLLVRHRNSRRSMTETEWYYGAKNFDWWGGSGTIREKTWHSSNNDDPTYESFHDGNNIWFIPSVPQYILNQRKCQAVIYYHIRDGEYVVISKSTIVHL